MAARGKVVQMKNSRTGLYTKLNRETGEKTHKKTKGPYKNVPVARKRKVKPLAESTMVWLDD